MIVERKNRYPEALALRNIIPGMTVQRRGGSRVYMVGVRNPLSTVVPVIALDDGATFHFDVCSLFISVHGRFVEDD